MLRICLGRVNQGEFKSQFLSTDMKTLFVQELTLEQVLLLAASTLQEVNNRDHHDIAVLFKEPLMIDKTLVLNMADIIGQHYYRHAKQI